MRKRVARTFILAFAAALLATPLRAEEVIELGDLLLVRGRVLRCPDRLRLVEVIRIEHPSHAMLALGELVVLGRHPSAVAAEIRGRLARELGSIPPVEVELRKRSSRDAGVEDEAWLLNTALFERACEGYRHPELIAPPDPIAAR